MSSSCPCPRLIDSLASHFPPKGQPFDLSSLSALTLPITDLSKSIDGCRNRTQDPSLAPMIVDLAESILNLCRAASASYSLVEDPTGPADDNFNLAAWSCSKSPMSLGNLILEDAEKTLLARHIVYVVLTGLSALLRSVYAWTGAEGRKVPTGGTGNTNLGVEVPPSLYGREVDKQVSLTLSRVLALLGKLFPA